MTLYEQANERVACGRCGGKGQWCGGRCFRCNGSGKRLTPKARGARARIDRMEKEKKAARPVKWTIKEHRTDTEVATIIARESEALKAFLDVTTYHEAQLYIDV